LGRERKFRTPKNIEYLYLPAKALWFAKAKISITFETLGKHIHNFEIEAEGNTKIESLAHLLEKIKTTREEEKKYKKPA